MPQVPSWLHHRLHGIKSSHSQAQLALPHCGGVLRKEFSIYSGHTLLCFLFQRRAQVELLTLLSTCDVLGHARGCIGNTSINTNLGNHYCCPHFPSGNNGGSALAFHLVSGTTRVEASLCDSRAHVPLHITPESSEG